MVLNSGTRDSWVLINSDHDPLIHRARDTDHHSDLIQFDQTFFLFCCSVPSAASRLSVRNERGPHQCAI